MQQPSDQCTQIKNDLRHFRFLSEEDVAIVAPYFECRQVRAGEVLWKEGELAGFAALVMSGRIEEKKNTEFPGRQVVIGVYSKGTMIGEFSLTDTLPRAVTTACLEDAELLLLSKESLDRLLVDHPAIGIELLKGILMALSIRLRKSFERLASIF